MKWIEVNVKDVHDGTFRRILICIDWIIDISENFDKSCNLNFDGRYYKTQESYDEIIKLIKDRRKIVYSKKKRLNKKPKLSIVE